MLLNEARRPARQTFTSDVVPLADQNRSLWDRAMIVEGITLVEQAFRQHQVGPYVLQGAIAAVHAATLNAAQTD